MLCSAILEILQVASILYLALIPEDQMSRTLLLRQIAIIFHRQQICICIPDAKWLCVHFLLGKPACFHCGSKSALWRYHSKSPICRKIPSLDERKRLPCEGRSESSGFFVVLVCHSFLLSRVTNCRHPSIRTL